MLSMLPAARRCSLPVVVVLLSVGSATCLNEDSSLRSLAASLEADGETGAVGKDGQALIRKEADEHVEESGNGPLLLTTEGQRELAKLLGHSHLFATGASRRPSESVLQQDTKHKHIQSSRSPEGGSHITNLEESGLVLSGKHGHKHSDKHIKVDDEAEADSPMNKVLKGEEATETIIKEMEDETGEKLETQEMTDEERDAIDKEDEQKTKMLIYSGVGSVVLVCVACVWVGRRMVTGKSAPDDAETFAEGDAYDANADSSYLYQEGADGAYEGETSQY